MEVASQAGGDEKGAEGPSGVQRVNEAIGPAARRREDG